MRSDILTEIKRRLTDYFTYEGASATSNKILCSHRDVPHSVYATPLPLYRFDLQRKCPPPPGPCTSNG